MNEVYLHTPLPPREYLGHVDEEGRVFENRKEDSSYVGRVELETGKIYDARHGPERHVGRVDSSSGKVYQIRLGPEEYLGRVRRDGKCYLHPAEGKEIYMGRVKEMSSLPHGGGAFLLLLLRTVEAAEKETNPRQEPVAGEMGKAWKQVLSVY